MPAWSAKDPRLGNNPLVFAVPFDNSAIVLDFAMSQYSYGKMETYKLGGKKLPYPGGFNRTGELTTDPGAVLETRRALPIGYWKGAGLSLILDILATILSGGLSTHEITQKKVEYGLSQVFIAINISRLSSFPEIESAMHRIIFDYKESEPVDTETKIRYPGENILKTRKENLKNGIPVNKTIWNRILSL
jgi:3-dehydro-L-gulonate 2-dehydrogenase